MIPKKVLKEKVEKLEKTLDEERDYATDLYILEKEFKDHKLVTEGVIKEKEAKIFKQANMIDLLRPDLTRQEKRVLIYYRASGDKIKSIIDKLVVFFRR